MAIVDFLQFGNGRNGGRNLGAGNAEAVAKYQLFILLLHMQNLENSCSGLFDDLMATATRVGILGDHTRFGSLDPGQAVTQAIQKCLPAVNQSGIGGELSLLQEPVLFQGELVELFAKLQMVLKRVSRTHECGVATGVVAITGLLGEPDV